MGESPLTYAHADKVATLTERVRRAHPQALAWAGGQVTALQHALNLPDNPERRAALSVFVAAHQHLTSTELAHLPGRDAVANDVLTTALHLASGIDWAATSVEVYQLGDGRWRVAMDCGHGMQDVPVPAPETPATPGGAA
ncbi:MAG TPA: hypothetical protein VJT31_25355 [Rugosimonospora sp.]|nr:hypothetical protein [Rugosimonospora sp.]